MKANQFNQGITIHVATDFKPLKNGSNTYTGAAAYPALYNILKTFRYRLRSFSWAYPFLLA